MIISDKELVPIIGESKNTLLVEPYVQRKYLPLGLAKIAHCLKTEGKTFTYLRIKDNLKTSKKQKREVFKDIDSVFMTSLFTYDSETVEKELVYYRDTYPKSKIIIGGVFASLCKEHLEKNYPEVFIFDGYSEYLDRQSVLYEGVDWQMEKDWPKYSFVFTGRGCPNRCKYCAVHRIESPMWINPNWKRHIDLSKPYVMLSDNNFTSWPGEHRRDVLSFVKRHNKRIVFDNGLDCKKITPEFVSELSGVKFVRNGVRLSFDRIKEDGLFQKAIKTLIDGGVSRSNLMGYALYNFEDTPKEANYRLQTCNELGIRPYPQQYTPLDCMNRKDKFVGKYWTKNLLRKFRFFWLMRGLNTKQSFDQYVRIATDISVTEEDIKAWELEKPW